jgi:serine/threonine protein kinase
VPFFARPHHPREIYRKIRDASFSYPVRKDSKGREVPLSKHVMEFIGALLQKDISKRLTVDEALQHPWLTGHAPNIPIPSSVLTNLRSFVQAYELKRAVWRFLRASAHAHQGTDEKQRLSTADERRLAAVFRRFDSDGSGRLQPDELEKLMSFISMTDQVHSSDVLGAMDLNADGTVDVKEFQVAHVSGGAMSTADSKHAFERFDTVRCLLLLVCLFACYCLFVRLLLFVCLFLFASSSHLFDVLLSYMYIHVYRTTTAL